MRRAYVYRKWTAAPARPVRYLPHQALADWFHGWRDGKRGVPALPRQAAAEEDGTNLAGTIPGADFDQSRRLVTTPRLETLRRRAEEQIAKEEVVFLAARDPITRELRALTPAIEQWRRRAAEAAAKLSSAREAPADEDLKERRTAETDRPDSLVRQRRLAEHARRLASAELAHERACGHLEVHLRRQAEITETLGHQKRAFQARKRRLEEHAGRRVATYWQQLVRSHDDGPELNSQLRPIGPELPGWTGSGDE
ncbi:hypothetical protein ABZ780_26290 [Micromonospora sp. NPDC047467]|uniref:hypothetical protein n=1 Tax=Micromonospora sp. NPDC047467 TaxID=3154814 RepID=UPI003407CFE3